MSQQSIENEKDVAQKRESSKRHNRRHAETSKNTERRREAEEVDPRHVVVLLWSLVWMSAGVRQSDRRAARRNRASDGSPRVIRDYDKPTNQQGHRAVKNEKCEPPMSEDNLVFRTLRAESAPLPNVSGIRNVVEVHTL